VLNAVHSNGNAAGLIEEQYTKDCNGGVIYISFALCSLLISNLTAIAVDAVTDAVYEGIFLAFDEAVGSFFTR
jgi:hypothetical protein